MPDDRRAEYRSRDAASLLMIGGFVVLLAVLVLLGSFAAGGAQLAAAARIVNLAAGVVLLLIGIALVLVSRRLRRPKHSTGDSGGAPASEQAKTASADAAPVEHPPGDEKRT